jgi:hypothetical protein
MIYAFKVDVTAIGLDEMREYPELGTSNQPIYHPQLVIRANIQSPPAVRFPLFLYRRDLS